MSSEGETREKDHSMTSNTSIRKDWLLFKVETWRSGGKVESIYSWMCPLNRAMHISIPHLSSRRNICSRIWSRWIWRSSKGWARYSLVASYYRISRCVLILNSWSSSSNPKSKGRTPSVLVAFNKKSSIHSNKAFTNIEIAFNHLYRIILERSLVLMIRSCIPSRIIRHKGHSAILI